MATTKRNKVKIILDCNSLDQFVELSEPDYSQIVKHFQHRFSFYPTSQLTSEMCEIALSQRAGKLKDFSRLLLDITGDYVRIMRPADAIAVSQINGPADRFMSTSYTEIWIQNITNLAKGNIEIIRSFAETVKDHKNKIHSSFQSILPKIRDNYDPMIILAAYMTAYAQEGNKEDFRQVLITAVDRPSSVWLGAFLKTFHALLKHYSQGRGAKRGDWFDAQQLVYLAEIDWLVSDDKFMAILFEEVYRKDVQGRDFENRRVVSVADFIDILKKNDS